MSDSNTNPTTSIPSHLIKQPSTWKVKISMTVHGHRGNALRQNLKTKLKKYGMAYSDTNIWSAVAMSPDDAQSAVQYVLMLFKQPADVVPSVRTRLSADVDDLCIEITKPQ